MQGKSLPQGPELDPQHWEVGGVGEGVNNTLSDLGSNTSFCIS